MFTGIVRAVGRVARLQDNGTDRRLQIAGDGLPWHDYSVGDSIAVNGVCLTAVAITEAGFEADVSAETLSVTTSGHLKVGSRVNLEPALAVGERLGGHMVSGHVDGVGTVRERRACGQAEQFAIDIPAELGRYVARKGSITVDGVSLTVNEVSARGVQLTIIPHTLAATTMGNYAVGTQVNIEVDMLSRYLERLLGADSGDITREFLKANGYG